MATDLERLVVSLEANVTKYEKALNKAVASAGKSAGDIERKFNKINPAASGLTGFASSFTKGMIGAIASAVSLEMAIVKIRQSIKDVDDLGDMSERIGLSTDAIQTLRHVLGQAGGDAAMADRAMDKFGDTMAEAALGGGPLVEILKRNNVSIVDMHGNLLPMEQLLGKFSLLIAGLSNPLDRLKYATDGFGRQAGPKMVGTLLEIANKGMPALIDAAKEMGVVVGKDGVEAAGELDKAFRKLEERIDASWKTFVVNWGGPAVLSVFETLVQGASRAERHFRTLREVARQGLKGAPTLEDINRATSNLPKYIAENALKAGLGRSTMSQADIDSFYRAVPTPAGAPEQPAIPTTSKPPARNTGGGSRTNDLQREMESTQKNIELLKVELETIDLNSYARERARKIVELETAAKKMNQEAGLGVNVITAEQRVKIDELAAAYADLATKLEAANGPLLSFAREARNTNKLLQETALDGVRGLEDALVGVVTGTETAAEAFKKMANAIIADLARIAIRQAITGPIANALGSVFGGGIPKFASGTNSAPGGLAIVGEEGPELVNLQRGAQVIPNDVLRGSGLGMSVTYAPSYSMQGTAEEIQRLRLQAANDRAEFASRVVETVKRARTGRML